MKRTELGEIIFNDIISMINTEEIYDGEKLKEELSKYKDTYTTKQGLDELIKSI